MSFIRTFIPRKRGLFIVATLFIAMYAQANPWLAHIDNQRYIWQLSIPGTHDACTGDGFPEPYQTAGDKYARTQSISLSEQFHLGVRAFDFRPAVDQQADGKSYLRIFHGIFPTRLSLVQAFMILRDSLAANPTEFAIIIMQNEHKGETNEAWSSLVKELLHSAEFKGLFADFRPDLTVGELRGKILLLARDEYDTVPVGGFVRSWTFSDDIDLQRKAHIFGPKNDGQLYVQDYYDMSAPGTIAIKCAIIRQMLATSYEVHTILKKPVWVINHTSGFSETAMVEGKSFATADGYRKNAMVTNQAVLDDIKANSKRRFSGLVMMDYTGVDVSAGYPVKGLELTKAIIAQNFKH
ncbi:MAG: hypothetical protein WAR39_11465 [Prevotella sp.]